MFNVSNKISETMKMEKIKFNRYWKLRLKTGKDLESLIKQDMHIGEMRGFLSCHAYSLAFIMSDIVMHPITLICFGCNADEVQNMNLKSIEQVLKNPDFAYFASKEHMHGRLNKLLNSSPEEINTQFVLKVFMDVIIFNELKESNEI